jgi:hypothetical protein
VKASLACPFESDWPYLWVDASCVKVRQDDRIVSAAVIVAVGVNSDGRREVLVMDIGSRRPRRSGPRSCANSHDAACAALSVSSRTPMRASNSPSPGPGHRQLINRELGDSSRATPLPWKGQRGMGGIASRNHPPFRCLRCPPGEGHFANVQRSAIHVSPRAGHLRNVRQPNGVPSPRSPSLVQGQAAATDERARQLPCACTQGYRRSRAL